MNIRGAIQLRVLWVAPNLNHYKSRFLARLAEGGEFDITVLAGAAATELGHEDVALPDGLSVIRLNVKKQSFAFKASVLLAFVRLVFREKYDLVLVPAERKAFPLIALAWITKFMTGFRLISYNHPSIRSSRDYATRRDLWISRIIYRLYDRIIFYTEGSREWAISRRLVFPNKASFANNTVDTKSIWTRYTFHVNHSAPKRLLFIGRLIETKRVDLLFEYFDALRIFLPDLELTIIGDGPDAPLVRSREIADHRIVWKGKLSDEATICEEMSRCHAVFVPGASGLSIVHAFCYGKPYITTEIAHQCHGPEIEYLRHGENGMLVSPKPEEGVAAIYAMLTNNGVYETYCRAAFDTAQGLSIQNWTRQMAAALRMA